MTPQLPSSRSLRVPLWKRAAALGLDLLAVGFVSSFMGSNVMAQGIVFLIGWLGMRVVLVYNNQGQSLGRWAMDMRIVETSRGRIPTLEALTKRELIAGTAAFLAFVGLTHLSPTSAWALLLFVPLGIDGSFAYSDAGQQAFHDQYADTLIIPSRRGYSLDVKIRKLVAYVQQRVKK